MDPNSGPDNQSGGKVAMKRSRNVRLVLIGGLSAGVLAGCDERPAMTADGVYTNNFYVPGAGYYHAPFRRWFSLPYNHYDSQKQLYYYGGEWGAQPFVSITNISSPTPEAVQLAVNMATDVSRGGFGGSSGGYGGGGYSGGGYHYYGGYGGYGGFHS